MRKFQAKLANPSKNLDCTENANHTNRINENQRCSRSDQSAWMFQAKLAADQVNDSLDVQQDPCSTEENLPSDTDNNKERNTNGRSHHFYTFRLWKKHPTLPKTI